MLLIVWQFRPAPGREAEFTHAYGSDGPWVSLFRKAVGYRESTLAQDTSDPGRFLVLDWWDSESSFETFKRNHGPEYAALDARCEALCAEERPIGRFQVSPAHPVARSTAG
jgi:heme-degrading monooxygenase HmoA